MLASSVEHSNVYALTPEELISAQPGTDGIEHPKVRADIVFFETPEGRRRLLHRLHHLGLGAGP